jgi:hypothetical protein
MAVCGCPGLSMAQHVQTVDMVTVVSGVHHVHHKASGWEKNPDAWGSTEHPYTHRETHRA